MERIVPPSIYKSIVQKSKAQSFHIAPLDYIQPIINGRSNHFFEWLNSGYIDFKRELSTMNATLFIKELLYGKDRDHALYLLLKGEKLNQLPQESYLILYLNGETYKCPLIKGVHTLTLNNKEVTIGYDTHIEIKIENMNLPKINYSCELFFDGQVVQKSPLYEDVMLQFENFNLKKWYI